MFSFNMLLKFLVCFVAAILGPECNELSPCLCEIYWIRHQSIMVNGVDIINNRTMEGGMIDIEIGPSDKWCNCNDVIFQTLMSNGMWRDLISAAGAIGHVTLIFSCDQAALWMVQSVCLSVCHTLFTVFPSSYHHEIFRSYFLRQKWWGTLLFFNVIRLTSRSHGSSILTWIGCFWTVTLVWIHRWISHDAQSLT